MTAGHHRSLIRQLRRLALSPDQAPDPAGWERLLRTVSDSYDEADNDRYILERSIDISSEEMRSLHDELTIRARHDALTGLLNRSALVEHLTDSLVEIRGTDHAVAVLFIDLDGFKIVNDTRGHAAGDALLIQVAHRINAVVRRDDLVARLGGDEFVVVCPLARGLGVALALADRIVESVQTPFLVNGQEVFISASVGVTMSNSGAALGADLLRQADMAMYRAKSSGRGTAVVFDEEIEAQLESRLTTEVALRNALVRGEFVLHYQPLVRLDTHETTGVEALVRWDRPDRGLVGPAEWLGVAEQARLLPALTRFVLRDACGAAATWPGFDGDLHVNLTSQDLQDPGLLGTVEATLARTGFPARRLVVELTESSLLRPCPTSTRTVAGLRALGVRLALDDFGTGYSALSYLRQLPIEILKIDRSFIAEVDTDPTSRAIVGAIDTMASALGLATIVEGVERPTQAAALQALGCQVVQGYLLARPMAASALRFDLPISVR